MTASPLSTRLTKHADLFRPDVVVELAVALCLRDGPAVRRRHGLCRDSIRSLEHWGVVPLFTSVVLGITWMAIVFATIIWRHDEGEPTPQLVYDVERPPARDGARRRSFDRPPPYLRQIACTNPAATLFPVASSR
jgi:hypothetical protein